MAAEQSCHCTHTRPPHEHYRGGSECALCDCPRYTPPRVTAADAVWGAWLVVRALVAYLARR